MNKFDYVTATIEEEKIRLDKIISYLEENNIEEELLEYKERYNNVCKYLNSKDKYLQIYNSIKEDKDKLNELNKVKDEYEVDNILLEDTLLNKFHEDTGYIYKNLLYENIKNKEENIRDILYLMFTKESSYTELLTKRNKLKEKLNKEVYPKTYDVLINQDILIEKQDTILDEIFIIENNIKVEDEKLKEIENSIMIEPILKILYEFWIIDSYDINKVNRSKLFLDNKSFISIKNDIIEEKKEEKGEEELLIPDLNLPGINEENQINIEGKNYI